MGSLATHDIRQNYTLVASCKIRTAAFARKMWFPASCRGVAKSVHLQWRFQQYPAHGQYSMTARSCVFSLPQSLLNSILQALYPLLDITAGRVSGQQQHKVQERDIR